VKHLRFTVPLLRFVIPIDRLQAAKPANAKGRAQTILMQKSSNISLQTLLRLVRIETPLEDILPNKLKASLAPKKKTSRTPKASSARPRPPSSRRKKK